MAITPKALSLIHLTMGQEALRTLETDPDATLRMVAIYNATGPQLLKAKAESTAMATLLDGAAEVDADEAEEILHLFFQRLTRYINVIGTSLPQPTPEQMELLRALTILKDLKDQEKVQEGKAPIS